MSADVFISYKSDEEAYARKIRSVLEANGISCWMAPDSIPLGSNYMKQIPLAIDDCKAMILLLSEKSQQSVWVKNEFSQAVTKNKLIIPYVIQDCPLQDEFAFSLSTMQQVFAYKNEEAAMEKVVHDIREALGKNDSPKVQINIVAPPKKTGPIVYILASLLAVFVIGAAVFFLRKPAAPSVTRDPVSIYYSEVIPYVLTGHYATAEEAKADYFENPIYECAFSILSFIRNDSGSPIFAEKLTAEILDCQKVEVPVLKTDGMLNGNVISAFVFNDGWGDAKDIHAKWYVIREEGVPEFPAFEAAIQGEKILSVPAGSAGEIFQTAFDKEELLAWARQADHAYGISLYTIEADLVCGETKASLGLYLMYDPDSDDLMIGYGGSGDELPTITLFAYLDVDDPPKELRFFSGDETPYITDLYRIEEVIIPNKSCDVTAKGKYILAGKEYTTDAYSVRVEVPHFDPGAYTLSGYLTRKLINMNMEDQDLVDRICREYWYHPESILHGAG